MTDHLGERAIPCLAHVIRSSCTVNGCLVHVPDVRREGRRLIPQTLRRCHPTSMCSGQLHNAISPGDIRGVEIVDLVDKLNWGDIPEVGHAGSHLCEWQKCQAVKHAAKMPRSSIVAVVPPKAQLLYLAPRALREMEKTSLSMDVCSEDELHRKRHCALEIRDDDGRVCVKSNRRELGDDSLQHLRVDRLRLAWKERVHTRGTRRPDCRPYHVQLTEARWRC